MVLHNSKFQGLTPRLLPAAELQTLILHAVNRIAIITYCEFAIYIMKQNAPFINFQKLTHFNGF